MAKHFIRFVIGQNHSKNLPLLEFLKQSEVSKILHGYSAKYARLACFANPRGKSLTAKRQILGWRPLHIAQK